MNTLIIFQIALMDKMWDLQSKENIDLPRRVGLYRKPVNSKPAPGTGGSGKSIKLEINPKLTHVEGAVAMARTNDPNSATSQFYITLAPQPFLDGKYAVFGKVVAGMDVVKSVQVGDVMKKVTVSN